MLARLCDPTRQALQRQRASALVVLLLLGRSIKCYIGVIIHAGIWEGSVNCSRRPYETPVETQTFLQAFGILILIIEGLEW